MGKKGRRPNRNKPKDIPAAAPSAVAAPRQVITSATDAVATFDRLRVSQDLSGILDRESEMSDLANRCESSNPRLVGMLNFLLGNVHCVMGREGGIEKASLYYKKAVGRIGKEGG